jgi:hypothetical protein
MTQQVPSRSKLRKGFLIVGIVLLIMGFFFFYWASRVNWDYPVTTYNYEINLAHSGFSPGSPPQFGGYAYYAGYVVMQPNDALTVSYPENIQINGTLKIVLVDINNNLLASSGYPFSDGVVNYKNEQTNYIIVEVYLIAQNIQNVTVSSTTTLNHNTKPNLVYFGVGAVLLSLGTITIFQRKERMISRKMLGLIIVIIGLVLVVSGLIMFLLEPTIFYGIPGCFCIGVVGPPPLYCYKTLHGLLFDSGLILTALGMVLMIVFRKEKINMKKREKGSISKYNDGNSLA